jgi:hypothetical protein
MLLSHSYGGPKSQCSITVAFEPRPRHLEVSKLSRARFFYIALAVTQELSSLLISLSFSTTHPSSADAMAYSLHLSSARVVYIFDAPFRQLHVGAHMVYSLRRCLDQHRYSASLGNRLDGPLRSFGNNILAYSLYRLFLFEPAWQRLQGVSVIPVICAASPPHRFHGVYVVPIICVAGVER